MKTLIATAAGSILLLIAVLVFAIWATMTDARQWAAFSTARQCKVTAHVRGDVFNTITPGPNGQVTIGVAVTPDKTGYTCDDGVTYFR